MACKNLITSDARSLLRSLLFLKHTAEKFDNFFTKKEKENKQINKWIKKEKSTERKRKVDLDKVTNENLSAVVEGLFIAEGTRKC